MQMEITSQCLETCFVVSVGVLGRGGAVRQGEGVVAGMDAELRTQCKPLPNWSWGWTGSSSLT